MLLNISLSRSATVGYVAISFESVYSGQNRRCCNNAVSFTENSYIMIFECNHVFDKIMEVNRSRMRDKHIMSFLS